MHALCEWVLYSVQTIVELINAVINFNGNKWSLVKITRQVSIVIFQNYAKTLLVCLVKKLVKDITQTKQEYLDLYILMTTNDHKMGQYSK